MENLGTELRSVHTPAVPQPLNDAPPNLRRLSAVARRTAADELELRCCCLASRRSINAVSWCHTDRLYAVARKTADKLEAKRTAAPVDPTTGRPLFIPATGRAPQQPRNRAGAPVGDYLYRIRCGGSLDVQTQLDAGTARSLLRSES